MRTPVTVLMFVQAALNLFLTLFGCFGAVVTPFAAMEDPDGPPMWFGPLAYGGLAILLAICTALNTMGAIGAMKGRNYNMAVAGAVAGIVSGMLCCNILGIALGVASLAMLLQSKEQFEADGDRPLGQF